MIKRKPKRKKNRSKKARKKVSLRSSLIKAVAAIVAIVILVVAAGLIIHYLMPSKQMTAPVASKAPVAVKKPPKIEKPTFEIYPEDKAPIEKPVTKPIIPPQKELPKVAIIIDDLGYDKKIAEKFLELDATFTFAILPFSPFQKKIAKRAQEKGLEVMLHLPMEPVEYPNVDPGPGTLLTSMSPDQLISQLQKNLNPQKESIPYGNTAYHLHDKVMQIRNNYDKNVFNGDIGRITFAYCLMFSASNKLIATTNSALSSDCLA